MLRSILRNVQHYLLYSSIFLVFLAFQRLQWYDQGTLAQPYGFDRPRYSSPDTAGRIFGGDESKEIGLFKFRLGLFHFALPIFSKDDSSWERTHELSSLMSVPLPPNKRRKSTEQMHLRRKEQTRLQLEHSAGQGKANQETTPKSTIAYVVVLPQSWHNFSTLQLASIMKNIDVLPKSIRRAHTNSSYHYQLYALTLNGAATTDHGGGVWKLLHEALIPEFQIININVGDFGEVVEDVTLKTDRSLKEIHMQQQGLPKLLTQHDIIVQMSLDSFLLRPLEHLFDVLLAAKEGTSAGETKNVDSFVLESVDASSPDPPPRDHSELILFRASSQEAANSYMKRLQCVSKRPSPLTAAQDVPEMDSSSQRGAVEGVHCDTLVRTSALLDRCLYDAGNSGPQCSHLSVKEKARVAHLDSSSKEECATRKGNPGEISTWLCHQWYSIISTE